MRGGNRKRSGVLLAVMAWAAGLCLCGAPLTVAAQSRPAQPCQAYAPGGPPAGSRAYRVPQLGEAGSPGRCDVTRLSLATHDDGLFRAVYGGTAAIKPSEAIGSVIEQLKRQVRCDAANACVLRIIVFAHGGLVPHSEAVKEAETLAPAMMADGYAPVFLVWNSDIWTTYGDRLCCVTQGEKDRNLAHMIFFAPTRLAGDIVASAARAPENYGLQAIRFHDSVLAQHGTQFFLEPGDRDAICAALTPCPEIDYPQIYDPGQKRGLLNGLDQPIPEHGFEYVVGFPVRLGTTAFTPQIGAAAWDNMVRRTRLAVQDITLGVADEQTTAAAMAARASAIAAGAEPSSDPCGDLTRAADAAFAERDRIDPHRRFTSGNEGAFLIFFKRLACEIRTGGFKDPEGKGRPVEVQLDYYGHSMGALVGNEVLARHPELPWRRIVYMAAATPTRDVRLMISSLLSADRPGVRFYSLMLHPLAESHDLEAHGIVPEGSLLEWIDEMFGGPRTVDDRMFGKWTNAEKTMAMFPEEVRQRMTFRVFPAQAKMSNGNQWEKADFTLQCAVVKGARTPPRCHPIVHGEFVEYAFWRDRYLCARDDCDRPSAPPLIPAKAGTQDK